MSAKVIPFEQPAISFSWVGGRAPVRVAIFGRKRSVTHMTIEQYEAARDLIEPIVAAEKGKVR